MFSPLLFLASTLPLTQAAETVLGVYIFSRHGDRTAKATPPTNLTDIGFQEVFTSGTWFRDQYVAANAASRIAGIEPDLVKLRQISASAPLDNVLQSSAIGFLAGLYPPVGSTLGSNALRNGTVIQAPLNGFQLIPVEIVTSGGSGSENNAWLQGATGCAGAQTSSNEYFFTPEYDGLLNSTMPFYQSILPMINGSFGPSAASYKNAYLIYDLLNVASIHNSTLTFDSILLAPPTFAHLRTLADTHELNLAFNSTSPVRAIAGSVLAAQILTALNATITTPHSAPKLNIQFGAYGSFASFFGLAGLLPLSDSFAGVADYASTMTFELLTNSSAADPAAEDISVRFLFHNGTTSNLSTPTAYPLFGQSATVLPWADFAVGMAKFSIGDQASWCSACGNTTGVCAASALGGGSSNSSGASNSSSGADGSGADNSSGGGMSNAVAGVIGAMVTLAVILAMEALIVLVGGLRLIRKKRLAPHPAEGAVENGTKA